MTYLFSKFPSIFYRNQTFRIFGEFRSYSFWVYFCDPNFNPPLLEIYTILHIPYRQVCVRQIRHSSSFNDDSCIGIAPTRFRSHCLSQQAGTSRLEDRFRVRKCATSTTWSFLWTCRHCCHTCFSRFLTGRVKVT
jgi:hypothetical protein